MFWILWQTFLVYIVWSCSIKFQIQRPTEAWDYAKWSLFNVERHGTKHSSIGFLNWASKYAFKNKSRVKVSCTYIMQMYPYILNRVWRAHLETFLACIMQSFSIKFQIQKPTEAWHYIKWCFSILNDIFQKNNYIVKWMFLSILQQLLHLEVHSG